MTKLKIAKGSLKDHHRFLADEIDDYAERPDFDDPIPNFPKNPNISQPQVKAPKAIVKMTSRWPRFKPDFNFEVASEESLIRLLERSSQGF